MCSTFSKAINIFKLKNLLKKSEHIVGKFNQSNRNTTGEKGTKSKYFMDDDANWTKEKENHNKFE
jgi:hypothetical protein